MPNDPANDKPVTASGGNDVEQRVARERAFHDRIFAEHTRESADKFYAVSGPAFAHYHTRLLDGVHDRDFLEYGCGPGGVAFAAADAGAHALGIDISPVAVEQAKARAASLGSAARFMVADATRSGLPDASFDVIGGSGILHHLDLESAFAEIRRLLRPGGHAVFIEPLGHNPAINWYRRRSPHMRSSDEHPLLRSDVALAGRYFSAVTLRFFNLTTLAAVPLRTTPLFPIASATLAAIDRLLLHPLSPLSWQAWMVVVECMPGGTSLSKFSRVH